MAVFGHPSGIILVLKSSLDRPSPFQNRTFCQDHPSKNDFWKKKSASKRPNLVKSLFERRFQRNGHFGLPEWHRFAVEICIGSTFGLPNPSILLRLPFKNAFFERKYPQVSIHNLVKLIFEGSSTRNSHFCLPKRLHFGGQIGIEFKKSTYTHFGTI